MAWQFAFRQTYVFNQAVENIRLPILFQPHYRLVIKAVPIAGVGQNDRSFGTLSQLLFVGGFGDVKGISFPLVPDYQLLVPATEFTYRLLYQPLKRSFSFELSIWVDTVPISSGEGGVDNTAALEAIAAQLTALQTTVQQGNAQIEASLDAQTLTMAATQAAIADQLAALQVSQLQSSSSLTAILAVLNLPTPTPTLPPSYLNLLFEGANGSTAFTDSSSHARTIVGYGSAQLSTARAVSGTTSLLLNGSTAYLEFLWNTSLISDFTITVDVYPVSVASVGSEIFSLSSSTVSGVNLLLELDPSANNSVRFLLRNDTGVSYFDFNSSLGIALNAWTNVQAIVSGSTASIKINNVISGSVNFTGTRQQGMNRARIGRLLDGDAFRPFNGWLDNFRIY